MPYPENNRNLHRPTRERIIAHRTWRMLQEARDKIAEMEETVNDLKLRRYELKKARLATLHRYAELTDMSQDVSAGTSPTP
ncbi:MAG: hypothetical protein IJU44_11545 [Kiritimatiellae bacterium]|nr:hypothetical protein [Kiritimatiellia bacterium]